MFRFLYFLLIIYLVYRGLRYFFRLFSSQRPIQKNSPKDTHEIIDIDYEEIKDEDKSKQSE